MACCDTFCLNYFCWCFRTLPCLYGKSECYASFSGSFMKSFMTLNIINFANVVRREKDRVLWNVRRVSSLWNIWRSYLILSLVICVHKTPIETGLTLFGLCLSIPSEWNDFFYQSNLIMAFLEKYTGKRKKEIQSQQESKTMFVSWIFFISLWVLWVLKPK